MMLARLHTDPPLEFYRTDADRALIAHDNAWRRLVGLSPLRRPLAVAGGQESANLTLTLDNGDGRLTPDFAIPPFGAAVELIDANGVLFEGVITGASCANTISLDVESGALSRPLPLRNTAEWGQYKDTRAIPYLYGRVTLTPIQYDAAGRLFVVSAGAIGGVDAIYRDGVATVAWQAYPGPDAAGEPVLFLELASPLADGEQLSCDARGRLHPTTGELLTHPALVLWDLLANLCGVAITLAELDAFRAASAALEIHGVIHDGERTIRAQVDEIMASVVGVWSGGMPGFAQLYPVDERDDPLAYEFGPLTAQAQSATTRRDAIANVLQVNYDYDWASGIYRRSLEFEAAESIQRYGRIRREVDWPWLRSPRIAAANATRLLRYLARSWWTITLRSATRAAFGLAPGRWVTMLDGRLPVDGLALFITNAELDLSGPSITLTAEASAEALPVVRQTRLSAAHDPVGLDAAQVVTQARTAEFTLRDSTGAALANARVTLDGRVTRISNGSGWVQFTDVAPGEHAVLVESQGHDNYTFGFVQP
ncbi:MAG: carboxypeptidase-like regulatory domain-containing protein [Gammaproteobacteria bacterium]